MGSAATAALTAAVAERIARHGPLPFDRVMAAALYDPDHGFYATGGRAGRRGDFLTSPEVGPLFGALVARHLDRRWELLGRPDPFVVVDAGAGPGTLAVAVLHAAPACAGALTYVLVERSAAQRAGHGRHLALVHPSHALPPAVPEGEPAAPATGPRVVSVGALPAVGGFHAVVANELLDNLPTRLLERTATGWDELRVDVDGDGGLRWRAVPADAGTARLAGRAAPDATVGARVPWQEAAGDWLRECLALVAPGGTVLAIDYADSTAGLAARPMDTWLRTYAGHAAGAEPLADLGAQDITCEVAVDQLALVRAPTSRTSQADFLAGLGIEALVDEGRRIWAERAGVADLAALEARSRVREAEALLDPAGLGAFQAILWER